MNILRLLPAVGLMLLASCLRSPLSDVEITDPSIIRVKAFVEYTNDNGHTDKDIYVIITDKNNQTVKLKNGHVRMNGKELGLDESIRGYTYQYPGKSDKVGPGTYRFEVELPDSSTYEGRVTYKAPLPQGFSAPDGWPADRDLEIEWQRPPMGWDVDFGYQLYLHGDAGPYPYSKSGDIGTEMRTSHTFRSKEFFDKDGKKAVNYIRLIMRFVREGQMAGEFLSGSSAQVAYSFEEKVYIE
jgi:hypothetical protein